MSINVSSVTPTQPAVQVAPAASTAGSPSLVSVVVVSDEPVTVETIPAVPPSEVLDAVRVASQSYDKLAASGHQVHFATDPQTGRLSIQLLDIGTGAHVNLKPSKVLDLASSSKLAAIKKGH